MNEQPLDLRIVLRTIWKRRLLVAAVGIVALVLGVAYTRLTPPEPQARAAVLLPSSDVYGVGNVSPYTQTQIIIATSTPVLAAAGQSVKPPMTADELRGNVSAAGESQEILEITVTSSEPARAKALANAVATNYIAYVTKAASTTNALVSALQQQVSDLTKQFLSLQKQINTMSARIGAEGDASPAGQRDEALLAGLRDQQQQVSVQLDNVDTELVNAEVSTAQNAGATKILEPAAIVAPPSSRTAIDALLAVAAGLLAGCILALATTGRDSRLRFRDAVAAALGVPVMASVDADPCKSVKDWNRLLESHHPSPVETWSVRRVLHRLSPADQARRDQLSLLALDDDPAAFSAAVEVAVSAAALGVNVQFVPGPESALSPLRAACLAHQQRLGAQGDVLLFPGDPDANTELSGSHLVVTLSALALSSPQVPRELGPTLLAVSAGHAPAEVLAKAALAASDAGSVMEGVLIVNPDPDDVTTGSLPQNGETWPLLRRSAQRPPADLTSGAPR